MGKTNKYTHGITTVGKKPPQPLLLGPKCQPDLQKGTDVGQLVEALLGEVEGVVLAALGLDGEQEVVLLKGLLEPVDP